MSLLSLSWLGLWPQGASLWRLLLLIGGSWLLARILAWTFAFYGKCNRLRCFPQPPMRSWLLGHLGLIPPTEQGLKNLTQLVATFPKGFKSWLGPVNPLISLCHPDVIKPVVNASGTNAELGITGAMVASEGSGSSLSPAFGWSLQDLRLFFLLFLSGIHLSPTHHPQLSHGVLLESQQSREEGFERYPNCMWPAVASEGERGWRSPEEKDDSQGDMAEGF